MLQEPTLYPEGEGRCGEARRTTAPRGPAGVIGDGTHGEDIQATREVRRGEAAHLEPVAREGQVVVAQLMKVALSADHRVTDGAQGAQFLGEIRRLLEHPAALLV